MSLAGFGVKPEDYGGALVLMRLGMTSSLSARAGWTILGHFSIGTGRDVAFLFWRGICTNPSSSLAFVVLMFLLLDAQEWMHLAMYVSSLSCAPLHVAPSLLPPFVIASLSSFSFVAQP